MNNSGMAQTGHMGLNRVQMVSVKNWVEENNDA
jgi:hypothetical protein